MADKGLDFLVNVDSTAVGSQRNATLTFNRNVIDVTTKDSNEDAEFIYGQLNIDLVLDALYVYNDSGADALISAQDNGTSVTIDMTTGNTGEKHFQFDGYVTGRELTADLGSAAVMSVTIEADGSLTFEDQS